MVLTDFDGALSERSRALREGIEDNIPLLFVVDPPDLFLSLVLDALVGEVDDSVIDSLLETESLSD